MNDYDENRIWSRARPELKDKNLMVTFNNRQRRLTWCFCNVSTHTEYQGYRYYRNRGSNEHNVNQGLDQSVNYFAKTAIKALNNAMKRSNVVAFYNKTASIIVQTHEKKFYLNGNKVTKQKLNALIPSLLMRLPLSSSQEEFVKFIDTIVQTDPVISNAIINKIEYKFWHYKDNREIVTLLNVEKTGKEHSAIELYEGVWVDFKDTQMKSFINSCKGNKNKFLGVSPEELYYLSRKEFLKSGQVQVVYAFLEQNRKASLVLQRSMELFENLTTRFKGRIYEKDFYLEGNTDLETEQHIKYQSMAVKGKQLDWIVVDRGYKQGRQDVSTYAVMPIENWNMTVCEEFGKISLASKTQESGLVRYPYLREWMLDSNNKKYVFIGPICIDQANTNVSLGDQFASRAMALLNDIHSFEQVSTLRQFAQYKPEIRVEWDELSAMQTRSCA
jgi:hypothetical protein